MAADPFTKPPALNAEGVDALALARSMEQWLSSDQARTARILCDHSGVRERGISQIRTSKRPHCSFDWADRLCLAMDIDLQLIAPLDMPPDRPRNRSGKPLDRHLQNISSGDLKLAHDLHWLGVPLRRCSRRDMLGMGAGTAARRDSCRGDARQLHNLGGVAQLQMIRSCE